ncbi:MAG: phosphohydrolase, partial [Nanoarchaeota archaeon]
VADIVYAVSNEKGKNRKQRANDKYYEGIRRTPFATFVKLCDRLANVTYSLDTNSKMFSVYQQEHDDFIKQLLVTTEDYQTYKDLIGEINYLLRTN